MIPQNNNTNFAAYKVQSITNKCNWLPRTFDNFEFSRENILNKQCKINASVVLLLLFPCESKNNTTHRERKGKFGINNGKLVEWDLRCMANIRKVIFFRKVPFLNWRIWAPTSNAISLPNYTTCHIHNTLFNLFMYQGCTSSWCHIFNFLFLCIEKYYQNFESP